MFYIVYYGLIGKRCFTLQWRCISYMEIAPLALPLYRSTALPLYRSTLASGQILVHAKNLPRYGVRVEISHTASHQTDDLWACFEVPKWRVFCHTA